MVGFFLAPTFIPSISPKLYFHYYVDAGPLFVAFTIEFFSLIVYSYWLLFRNFRTQTLKRQIQIKYVAVGMMVGFACGSFNFPLAYGIPLRPWPSLFIPFYALCVTYAIVRHQLLDIRVAITRTGLLLGTYMVVLGTPFLVGWWGQNWLEQHIGEQWWLVPLGLCTVLATAGPFAYAYLRRQAEERLLKEQRRYQRTLQHAARGMTRVRNLTKLANLITRIVSGSVRVTHASLFLWEKTNQRYVLRASHGPKRLALRSRYSLDASHRLVHWLREHHRVLSEEDVAHQPESGIAEALKHLGSALIIPGLIEDHLVGFLALGAKVSGAGYSSDDLHAFTTLANEAAMAIENAMSYEELVKVNEQLKAASERLLSQERLAAAGQFATGMAHEIKNPLSAIKTFAQYLPEKYADPAFRQKFFRIVQSEIDRINTIVKELSDFAKPAPLQLQPVKVAELVKDTLTLLSDQCLKQGVEVRTSLSGNGTTIQADPQQLKQVLLNLLLNSLEAMARGGHLEVVSRAAPPYLTIRIVDTGDGIPPEHAQKVWDPFFTTKERGMGLGLAIVRGVVERHGGQIAIASAPGRGTTVEVSLPLSAGTEGGVEGVPAIVSS